jgi:hypothetical protein
MAGDSILTDSDWQDFLLGLYFDLRRFNDPLIACVRRAYLDFSRTMHGMSELSPTDRDALVDRASADVQRWLQDFPHHEIEARGQIAFDEWHYDKCMRLNGIFKQFPGPFLHIGQAQKWLNMTFKYVYTFGEHRLPGFAQLYPYCHVPLDTIVLAGFGRLGASIPPISWSRLDDYEIYIQLQRWVRSQFRLAPLDVEFLIWSGKRVPGWGGDSSVGAW